MSDATFVMFCVGFSLDEEETKKTHQQIEGEGVAANIPANHFNHLTPEAEFFTV